jgi:hypothetical protein
LATTLADGVGCLTTTILGVQTAGGVVDLDLMNSHRETKLVAIDKQTNDNVMHLGRLGKADRFACEPLDSHAQCQMFPFNLLHMTFARDMSFGGQVPGICSPMIGKEAWVMF